MLLLVAASAILFASCTTVYKASELTANYDVSMTSKKELAVKNEIAVFYSENEVTVPFEVISMNNYKPLDIPILHPGTKDIKKNIVRIAVYQAKEQGGNAVVLLGEGLFKVIKTGE